MPELPEVETIRCQLDERLRGRTIASVDLLRQGREFPHGFRFVQALSGQTIASIERRAKLIVWRFEDATALIAHLKMTGRFVFVDDDYQPAKHDRAVFVFDDRARLVWSDIRQFGFLKIVGARELDAITSAFGPEPLPLDPEELADLFDASSPRRLKAALLDQTFIAGIGNIYADEACHRAGVRPTRRLPSLTAAERLRLAHAIQRVLRESIAQQGTSANDYVDTQGARGGFLDLLRVYGREGQPCLNCQTPIKKIVLMQRGTHYCPGCQR